MRFARPALVSAVSSSSRLGPLDNLVWQVSRCHRLRLPIRQRRTMCVPVEVASASRHVDRPHFQPAIAPRPSFCLQCASSSKRGRPQGQPPHIASSRERPPLLRRPLKYHYLTDLQIVNSPCARGARDLLTMELDRLALEIGSTCLEARILDRPSHRAVVVPIPMSQMPP